MTVFVRGRDSSRAESAPHRPFRRQGRVFPWLFLPVFALLLLSSCSSSLEKAYDVDQGLRRMNSVALSRDADLKAESFAAGLCVLEDGAYNAEDIAAPRCLLFNDTAGEAPAAMAYKSPFDRSYPASITKIMTVLVCLQNVDDLSREFTITQNSVITESGSSTAFLQVGEAMRIEDLLYALMLPSGNDAAVAVAEATAGSVEQFVAMMNAEALRLGCTGTHFVNPHGLPDDQHYTTPYDIYLILREAMRYEIFQQIAATVTYDVHYKDRNGIAKSQTWQATNQFLTGERELPQGIYVLSGKTGTTSKAGYCLALCVGREGTDQQYYSIVMKDESRDALYTDMAALLQKIH